MDLANKKPLIAGVAIVGLAILAWLAFGFFGIQAAFLDNEVDEGTDDLFTASTEPVEEAEVPPETEEEPENDQTEPDTEEAAEPEPADDVTDEVVDETAPEEAVEEAVEDAPDEVQQEAGAAEPGEIVTIASGSFTGTDSYAVSGDVLVLNNGTDQRFLRFENFASDNGPDLKVYLRAENGDFVSLGDLSGNIGDQNYEIPVDVDLEVYNGVEIWCERFSALFGSASLA